ncbi:hypothetical protein M569_13438, partial [Genlisea aurea]
SGNCASQTFSGSRPYAFCNDLPSLGSSIRWSYDPADSALSIAFTAPPAAPGGWVSWAINPTGTRMRGSQALVAFRESGGGMAVKTYNITGYAPLTESPVWFQVRNSSAVFSGSFITISATLVLPESGKTAINQVWQVGSSVSGGVPDKHQFLPPNLNAVGTLDLLAGQRTTNPAGAGDSTTRNRNIHGLLNALSWGILFPIGIFFPRYLKTFPSADPSWFYLHVACQVSAYAIGVAGWATGMKLGSHSKTITYPLHRSLGIALFSIATLQVFALFLRPKKDHKYRLYWNAYHHSVGYAIVVLGIVNVFRGLTILQPEEKWRHAYIAAIAAVGAFALLFEAATWIVVLRRKKWRSWLK